MNDITENQRIYTERIRQILKLAPLAIFATFVNATILVLILWKAISHGLLVVWYCASLALVLERSLLLLKYRPASLRPEQASLAAKLYMISLGLSGALWGCVAIFLFPIGMPTYQILVVIVLCGMVAGATSTFSLVIEAFMAFMLPALIPLVVRFILIGGTIYYAMAALTLLYMILTVTIARRINEATKELVELKEDFAWMLEERTAELLNTNEQLKLEIEERKRGEEERIHLESQLQQAHRIEAIATLAGGIAHQFNNALFVISGNVELFEKAHTTDERTIKYIQPIKTSVRQMANLTNQLLAYAQGGMYKPGNVSLTRFVQDALPIIKYPLDPSIVVETDLHQDVVDVAADTNQLQMVLSAVVTNAAEAITGAGKITITTENKEIDEDLASRHTGLKPGLYVCLSVEDNGKGMDEETCMRVFEPFFTTKFHGRGLGMAAAYGIIKSHGGWIWVDSKPDTGTVVHIYLPAVRQHNVQ